MALTNPATGEYLRIEGLALSENSVSQINYSIYANAAHRQSGDTEFLKRKSGFADSGHVADNFASIADSTLSIENNIKTAGYLAIKADNFEFSAWEDC